MAGQPTVIYSAANAPQAYLLRGLLEEQGITASVVNDALQVAGGELPLGWTTAPRVVVAESDAVQARALAEQFDRQAAHKLTVDDSLEAEPLAEWKDWPVCPQCGQRRSARCGVCGISRTDFPLADMQDGVGHQQVLLKCEDCDDLIRPEWYRLCAACGYDFGSGIQIGDVMGQDVATSRSLVAIVIALAVGALALAAYFSWLFTGRVV